MRGLASKYGRKRTFSRSCKSQRIGGSESLWQNGGWGYGGGLTTGEIDPLPRGFWLEALACSKEQRNQARKARPRASVFGMFYGMPKQKSARKALGYRLSGGEGGIRTRGGY